MSRFYLNIYHSLKLINAGVTFKFEEPNLAIKPKLERCKVTKWNDIYETMQVHLYHHQSSFTVIDFFFLKVILGEVMNFRLSFHFF